MGRKKYDIMVKPFDREFNRYQIRFTSEAAMAEFVDFWRRKGLYAPKTVVVRLGEWVPILNKQFNNILFGLWSNKYSTSIDVIDNAHFEHGLPEA